MDLPPNPFRRALASGRQLTGLWNSVPGPSVTELLAMAGYDWIVLDTEHSPTDVPEILPMLQAVAAWPVAPVVRPAANDPVLIKRLLDFGAQTLMIPYVQSAEEARAAVRAMRYAPRGIRGVSGMTRASRYGAVEDYIARAEGELCLIVQVETAEAIARIEEIAAVDGVDAIFVGPADLAASLGEAGRTTAPAVLAAVEGAVRRIVAAGKPAGVLMTDPQAARACIGWGTTFTAVGTDLGLLAAAARRLRAEFAAG
jgi:4-hydroxy-2-oxoheptanedioate aldolase